MKNKKQKNDVNKSKTKILYYNGSLQKGGTEAYMLQIIRNANKEEFEFDVLIKNSLNIDYEFEQELRKHGCNISIAPNNTIRKAFYFAKFFRKNKKKYDVIHINATSKGVGIIAYMAKKYGKIGKVIFHSHMGGANKKENLMDRFGGFLIKRNADVLAACSRLAGNFMFGSKYQDKVVVLNNFIDLNKFEFNPQKRNDIRQKLNILKDEFVILHVGRFDEQKNHDYLIDVFAEAIKTNKNYKLFLVGDGHLKEEVVNKVKSLNIEKFIDFCGIKNNVHEFMQAADCFIMTSRHEGLPIVAVEAQSCGLPCLLSSKISKETDLIGESKFIDIDEKSIPQWVDSLNVLKEYKRKNTKNIMIEKGFSIENGIVKVEEIYR